MNAHEAIELLQHLVRTPSLSREEAATAEILSTFLEARGVEVFRKGNNVWARGAGWSSGKPLLLLNSHHDTVRPNAGYTRDPFGGEIQGDTLYGLGSNDAGASVVSLMAAFLHFAGRTDLPYNIVVAITAEEECSGAGGVESILGELGPVDVAIVGEPTQMQMAVAERGLLVVDCTAHGRAGHAARNEGQNAIYKAIQDIEILRTLELERGSELLGPVKFSTTMISAGTQHNVVPDSCSFTVDIRVNECYTLAEVLDIVRARISSDVKPRSLRLNSSSIALDHPLVLAGLGLGRTTYGSPTTSDGALLHGIPTLKMGPGDSARSHTPDEYIHLSEIEEAIPLYINLLNAFFASHA